MYITILFITMFILGVISVLICEKADDAGFYTLGRVLGFLGSVMTGLGVIAMGVIATLLLVAHVAVDKQIETNQIEYQSLTKRLEIINSDYEDISKLDAIRSITQWNIKVCSDKYYYQNPWTSWFYDGRVVEAEQYIDIE